MLSKLIYEGSPHSQLRLLVINLQSAGGEACGMAEVALGDTEFPSAAQVWDFRRRPCSGSRRDGERQNPDAAVQQAFHDLLRRIGRAKVSAGLHSSVDRKSTRLNSSH